MGGWEGARTGFLLLLDIHCVMSHTGTPPCKTIAHFRPLSFKQHPRTSYTVFSPAPALTALLSTLTPPPPLPPPPAQHGLRLDKERQRTGCRIQSLQADLRAMRDQQEALRQQLADKVAAHGRAASERNKELAALRRAGEGGGSMQGLGWGGGVG